MDNTDGVTDLSAEELIMKGDVMDSVYLSGATFGSALLSAGGAIETTRAVVQGLIKNAIAIIRPPGHHAECNRAMGFCIFDNVSIATKSVMKEHPDIVKKVLILDWYIIRLVLDLPIASDLSVKTGTSITATGFSKRFIQTLTSFTSPFTFMKTAASTPVGQWETIFISARGLGMGGKQTRGGAALWGQQGG